MQITYRQGIPQRAGDSVRAMLVGTDIGRDCAAFNMMDERRIGRHRVAAELGDPTPFVGLPFGRRQAHLIKYTGRRPGRSAPWPELK